MSPSYRHTTKKQMLAHYLSPLHICAPLIRLAYKIDKGMMRTIVLRVVRCYDVMFKVFLLPVLK